MWFPIFKPVQLLRGNRVLLDAARLADSFPARFVGLMFRPRLQPGEALILSGCRSVHTVSMCFTLDLVFVDARWVIVRLVCGLPPNRAAACAEASHVIEMAEGSARRLGLSAGQKLALRAVSDTRQPDP